MVPAQDTREIDTTDNDKKVRTYHPILDSVECLEMDQEIKSLLIQGRRREAYALSREFVDKFCYPLGEES